MGRTDSIQQTKHNPDSLTFTTQGLTKVYGEGEAAVHALRGVDLEIPSGEMVVLLGCVWRINTQAAKGS